MNELVSKLVSQLGVNEGQAEGGLGAILSLAKDNLDGEMFSKITDSLGGTDDLISKFSSLSSNGGGGLGGMLGAAASALGANKGLGGIAAAASALSSLDINLDTFKKFAPVVSSFLKEKGLDDVAAKIDSLS